MDHPLEKSGALLCRDSLIVSLQEIRDLERRLTCRLTGAFFMGVPKNEPWVERLAEFRDLCSQFRVDVRELLPSRDS